jgi:hypothetical protein
VPPEMTAPIEPIMPVAPRLAAGPKAPVTPMATAPSGGGSRGFRRHAARIAGLAPAARDRPCRHDLER